MASKLLSDLLTQEQKDFPKFVYAVMTGLGKAVITEPDMFILFLSTISRRKAGIALLIWFLARRADQYVSVLDSKATLLARVIAESNQRGE